ncbi:MAG: cupin domain-containing protein [Candidatus Latescibacterota bacterium]|nr:MAG: cupin domain-containing protein [Candidatus Latescibacterota bacterium]
MISNVELFPDFIEALPEIDLPFPSARGWLIQAEDRQIVFASFDEETNVPEHSHAEQWEFVLAGKVDLNIDGEACTYQAGDNFYIPAGVPHAGLVHAGYKAMIVFNAPDRYQPKAK